MLVVCRIFIATVLPCFFFISNKKCFTQTSQICSFSNLEKDQKVKLCPIFTNFTGLCRLVDIEASFVHQENFHLIIEDAMELYPDITITFIGGFDKSKDGL